MTEVYVKATNAYNSKEWKTALDLFLEHIAANPTDAEVYSYIGSCLGNLGNVYDALRYAHTALQYEPINPKCLMVVGSLYQSIGMYIDAKKFYDKALIIAPYYAQCRWNRAHVNLALGETKEGWEDYEYGSILQNVRPNRALKPQWDGLECPGKTIFIWAEQGLGDQVLFARWIKKAKEVSKANIILEVRDTLINLFNHNFDQYVDHIFAQSNIGHIPYEYDYQCSLSSLPYVLDVDTKDIWDIPYINAVGNVDIEKLPIKDAWGLVWSGSKDHPNDKNRSLPLDIAKLFHAVPFNWVSLQPGEDRPFKMESINDAFIDMSYTASIIPHLKGIVTIDSVVANLAGAMGLPNVYVIAPLTNEYRWGIDGTSLYYPTLNIIRPSMEHGFKPTIDALCKTLKNLHN